MKKRFVRRLQIILLKLQYVIRRLLPHAPILLIMLLIIITGIRGIDFGFHWDEITNQVDPMRSSIRRGTFLPGFYTYPSVNYWLNLVALFPSAANALLMGRALDVHLLDAIDTFNYLERIRGLHVVVSALAVLWVYLAVWFWRKRRSEAFLAAAFLGLSWEVAYHSRWAAPDSIMMQFGALTLLMMVLLHLNPDDRKWRRLAAVSAALACGTKYPGGIFLIPLLVLVLLIQRQNQNRRGVVVSLLETVAIFSVVFIVTTPGSLLQPWRFWEHVIEAFNWYRVRGLWGFTVEPGVDHLSKMVPYLSLELFSNFALISAVVILFALIGAVAVLYESRRLALILVFFPLFYVLYFSSQSLMIVRNLLAIAPFMSILAAHGMVIAWERLNRPVLKYALIGGVGAMLAINAAWLVHAGETIRDRHSDRFVQDLAEFVTRQSSTEFYLSPRLLGDLETLGVELPANAQSAAPERAEVVALYAYDAVPNWRDWPGNNRNLTVATFGPREVNFNYYPNWEGNENIVLLALEMAEDIGVEYGLDSLP